LDGSKSKGGKLVFVGDGLNDAPVLARSDIGVAMGGLGSDAAIEAADVVLMTDEPSKLVTAIKIAKRTKPCLAEHYFLVGRKSPGLAARRSRHSHNVGSRFRRCRSCAVGSSQCHEGNENQEYINFIKKTGTFLTSTCFYLFLSFHLLFRLFLYIFYISFIYLLFHTFLFSAI